MEINLINITKRFPGVLANSQINFSVNPGEVHALLGENGAGKTTLMNILYGLYTPDEGEIVINGAKRQFFSPSDAISAGIGMVHQHFMLIPALNGTENVMLGVEETRFGFLVPGRVRSRTIQISKEYGLEIDPDIKIENLPIGVQQRVEIIKALYRDANCLILDEPTAVLTPTETEDLFRVIRMLKSRGRSIIFISHKLSEVMEIADRITVLRKGRVVGTTTPDKTDEQSLANLMVDRELDMQIHKLSIMPGKPILEIKDLVVQNDRGQKAVNHVSILVRAGEIVALAGIQGNGQTELIEAIIGRREISSGKIYISGKDITGCTPRTLYDMDIAYIPEDREQDGLILSFPIKDNLIINNYYKSPYARNMVVNHKAILKSSLDLMERFDIRAPSPNSILSTLSGGNQQKVIAAREFSKNTMLLIAAQPTRGLDIGSIQFIHSLLISKRDEGCAIFFVSTELDEIMDLADKIAVMFRGKITRPLDRKEATREKIGLMMAGLQAFKGNSILGEVESATN
jgi:simple sugar transport system ATP-binding protein